MTFIPCHLPDDFAQDIRNHEREVERFLSGELSAAMLKARRVPRGIYEQRQNGTYMVRVRVPGGALSAAQTRVLAGVGSRYGSGTLHVTTRQDIQIHEVKIEQTPAVMWELFRNGLTSKGGGGNTVRNITACPYAGICPAEHFDVTPSVVAVTEHLIRLPGSYNLPRKYKIAFSGCSADCALAQVNDLGFIARLGQRGEPGFSVWAGGGMGAESRVGDRMEEWIPAGEVIRTAEAVRRLFDRLGDRRNRRRARLRFAVERVGAEAFRTMLRETVQRVKDDGIPSCEVRIERVEAPAEPSGDHRTLLTQIAGLTVLRQRQAGYAGVLLQLPLGQISWQVLESLADIAERFSAEKALRATRDQKLQLRFVREADLEALRADLDRALGPDNAWPAPLAAFTTCTGAATCRLGLCLSQNAARACATALADAKIDSTVLQTMDIRMNGCPNACGQHPIGTIGLFGAAQRVGDRRVPVYRVLLGARRGEGRTRLGELAGAVPARALPAFLVDLLGDFQTGRRPEEAFADYFDRKGMGHFQSVLRRHTKTPPHAEDPAFYRDWGRNEDFSLAGRGPGECGAGVFEAITEELSVAAKALEQVERNGTSGAALFGALLATTRALLIARGVDSQDPDVILRSFETHFVDTALVDDGFRGLLARGRGYREGWDEALAGRQEEIRRLLDQVERLYSTLDAELRFQAPEARRSDSPPTASSGASTAEAAGDKMVTAELDLRGVACPMNFVKAKLRLEQLAIGDTLGMLLDDGEPVRNVPTSFQNEGQEILEVRVFGDRHWLVIVRKTRD